MLSNHNHLAYAVIVNKAFWDGLPPDVRAGLEKAMQEATAFVNASAKTENDEALAKIKANGKTEVVELTPEQRAQWIKAVAPVYTEMAPRVGQETIDAVAKATGFALPK
jgi:C4-dicarboxylate-binding protein DctP